MKTNQQLRVPLALGMDQQEPPALESAGLIENYTVDPITKGWDNRIGYEKYLSAQAKYGTLGSLGPIDSLYIWVKRSGSQQLVIFESNNVLNILDPTSNTKIEVSSQRTSYSSSDYGTFYVPFGDYLIVLNGVDDPMKLSGWPMSRPSTVSNWKTPLGFLRAPAAPEPWDINNNPDELYYDNKQSVSVFATSDAGELAERGLGSLTSDADNRYQWKVTFVSDSGSESQISHPSRTIEWQTPGTDTHANFRFNALVEMPTGTFPHIQARRLYRTKSNDFSSFYFVAQIDNPEEMYFYDPVGDAELVNLAPEITASVQFPAPAARFGAAFKNCLFLEGGLSESTRLYYSNPGKPDQYGALDFLELGARYGGAITGLHAHYDMLLVLRERSVDVVTGEYPNFVSTTLVSGIGSLSPKAIVTVPELTGVMFLGTDGVYLFTGGLSGGSQVQVQKISDPIMKTAKRFTKDSLAGACAVYSSKWREVHFYVPVDGGSKPQLGIVFHTDKNAWSLRESFPVQSVATDKNDEIVFGHNTGSAENYEESGLFVISRIRQQGYTFTYDPDTQVGTVIDKDPYLSRFRSPVLDFGDPTKKKFVKYVYLYVKTYGGDNTIKLNYYLDHDYSFTASTSRKLQRPDHPDQPIFDKAVYNADVWQEGFLTELRFPVHNKACSYFQWEMVTDEDVVLVGYSIDFDVNGMIAGDGKETPSTRSRA